MATLEEKLEYSYAELGVSEHNRGSINAFLAVIRQKDIPTYEHSVRVGLLSRRIAQHMHLDQNALFYAGTLHDVGKALIEPEILKKTEKFDERDMEQMRKHVEYSYQLLRGVHEFSAEIALRHHMFQEKGYPKRLPKPKVPYSGNTQIMINFYARLLSLADFYDALTTRNNDKHGEKRKIGAIEAKQIMLDKNRDQKYLIEELYKIGIFRQELAA
mgnify:CR=1 FL=1